MIWLWVLLGLLVGLPLLGMLVGSLLPRNHVARVTIELHSPPERIWALVSDFPGTPAWRPGILRVEPATGPGGETRFVESSKQGQVTFEVLSREPPRHQVMRVVDEGQPFGGTWTWELTRAGAGTTLRITEAGFIKNPLFRVIGKLFFSPTATLEQYCLDLARTLGEEAQPRISAGAP